MRHYSTYQSQFIEMFGTLDNPKGEIESLGTVCNIQRGGSPRPISEYITDQSDGLNWIKIGDTDDSMYITKTEEKIKPSGLRKTRQVYEGDLLLSNSMSFGRPYILKIDGCIHDGWLVLHINDAMKLSPVYLCSYLSQQGTYAEMAKLAAGGVVQNLNSNIVRQLDVIVPAMEEQIKYIQILEQADKSKFTRLKSQFIEMFSGMSTTPIKTYVDDSFPGEWGAEDTMGNGVKVIRTTNFTNSGKLNLVDVVTRNIEDRKVARKQIRKYDTILERSGGTADNPVGRVVLFEEDDLFLCNNFTQVLRFKDVDPRFAFYSLYYFYQTNKTAIRSMGSKTTGIQNLNMSKYLEIGIPNGSDDEQKAFVAIAEQADKSKYIN